MTPALCLPPAPVVHVDPYNVSLTTRGWSTSTVAPLVVVTRMCAGGLGEAVSSATGWVVA